MGASDGSSASCSIWRSSSSRRSQFVHEQRVVLAKDQPVGRGQRRALGRQMLPPFEMELTPVRSGAIHKPAPRQKLEDIMTRFQNLALKGFAAAHDVADPFVRFARNTDHHELTGAIEAGQIRRVAFVMFALHARPFGNQRRRDHLTGIAPRRQGSMQDVPSATRLVARADLTLAGDGVEPLLQFGQTVRQPVEARRTLRPRRQDRDRDRLLVHIHAEIDD